MRAALAAAFSGHVSRYRWDEALFGSFVDYDSLPAALRYTVLRPTDEIDEPETPLVAGHLSMHGMLRLLDAGDMFTVLREPRARLLSHQLYWALLPEKAAFGNYEVDLLSRDGLGPLLSKDVAAHQHDNLMCRMLARDRCSLPIDRPMTEAERAMAAAAAIEVADSLGLATYLESPQMWDDVSTFVGAPIQRVSVNVTQPREASATFFGPQFDQATQELLYERTAADALLYSHVVCARTGCTPAQASLLADRHFIAQVERYARTAAITEHAPSLVEPQASVVEATIANDAAAPIRRPLWKRAARRYIARSRR